jgi:hypothetical protein
MNQFQRELVYYSLDIMTPHKNLIRWHYSLNMFSVAASSDPNTMTFYEAMQAPDREEFIKAMKKELHNHIKRKHWTIVPLKSIPPHKRAIPMIWSMKFKKDPMGEIIKRKARLCA